MLTMIPFDDEHVLGVCLRGHVSKEEYDALNARMEQYLREQPYVSIYAQIPTVDDLPVTATLQDLIIAMRHWKKLEKKAVVTDMRGVKFLEPMVDKLAPGIDVRVFDEDNAEAARAWVTE